MDNKTYYHNLKEMYFNKASVAHNRGWSAVAQYYAEMGHDQTRKLNEYSNLASIQTFLTNDNNNDKNTIDLHGLTVKESLLVLKKMISERKEGKIYSIN
jgi:DNA-nicking Smr family endonuclease